MKPPTCSSQKKWSGPRAMWEPTVRSPSPCPYKVKRIFASTAPSVRLVGRHGLKAPQSPGRRSPNLSPRKPRCPPALPVSINIMSSPCCLSIPLALSFPSSPSSRSCCLRPPCSAQSAAFVLPSFFLFSHLY